MYCKLTGEKKKQKPQIHQLYLLESPGTTTDSEHFTLVCADILDKVH